MFPSIKQALLVKFSYPHPALEYPEYRDPDHPRVDGYVTMVVGWKCGSDLLSLCERAVPGWIAHPGLIRIESVTLGYAHTLRPFDLYSPDSWVWVGEEYGAALAAWQQYDKENPA